MKKKKRKYKIVHGRKTYTCIMCGKEIPKGSEHITLPIHSRNIAEKVSEYVGSHPWEIKWKTKLFFFDSITLRFCSWQCFVAYHNFRDNLPQEVQERIRKKEEEIVNKILDSLKLAYKIS